MVVLPVAGGSGGETTSADPSAVRARQHRARQMVVGTAIAVAVMVVLGVVGNHQADRRAARHRDKLASALAHVSYGDAALAPNDGLLSTISKETGTAVGWTMGSGRPQFSDQVVGWWFWAPRCVVGVVGTVGATVTISKGSQCPPAGTRP